MSYTDENGIEYEDEEDEIPKPPKKNLRSFPKKTWEKPEEKEVITPVKIETPKEETPEITNLEDTFQGLFSSSASGSGEEELLRIASKFSLQVTAKQIRCLLFLLDTADYYQDRQPKTALRLRGFVTRYLEQKQYNNSDVFVMKALEFISLRKFLNENSFKVDIQK